MTSLEQITAIATTTFYKPGSGGCMFFYVPDEKIEGFRQAIASTGAVELNYRFQRSYEPGILLKRL